MQHLGPFYAAASKDFWPIELQRGTVWLTKR